MKAISLEKTMDGYGGCYYCRGQPIAPGLGAVRRQRARFARARLQAAVEARASSQADTRRYARQPPPHTSTGEAVSAYLQTPGPVELTHN